MTCLRLVVAATLLSMVAVTLQPDADVVGADAAGWQQHRSTRVLYAGWPNGSREAAFRAFLTRHFDHVQIIDLARLSKPAAAGFHVVIADWASQYGKDGYPDHKDSLRSAPVSLPDDFDVPVIAMDYVSTNLRSRKKLDWL